MQKNRWISIALAVILSSAICAVIAYKNGVQDARSQAILEAQRHIGAPLKSDPSGNRVTVFITDRAVTLQTEVGRITVANFGPDGRYARAAAEHAMSLWNAAVGLAK